MAESNYENLQPLFDELNDLRTFVWLVAEVAYDADYTTQWFGEEVSDLLSEAFDV